MLSACSTGREIRLLQLAHCLLPVAKRGVLSLQVRTALGVPEGHLQNALFQIMHLRMQVSFCSSLTASCLLASAGYSFKNALSLSDMDNADAAQCAPR